MLELIDIFFNACLIGLLLSLIVGPLALLCMQQTLTYGLTAGIVCGLGVATADSIYGALAGLGLTFVKDIFQAHHVWLRIAGGGALLYLGFTIFNRRITSSHLPPTNSRLFNMYVSTCALTLANPVNIVPSSAYLASLQLPDTLDHASLIPLIAGGIFVGSALWWIILCSAVSFFRTRISFHTLQLINKAAGVFFILFGIGVLLSLCFWC